VTAADAAPSDVPARSRRSRLPRLLVVLGLLVALIAGAAAGYLLRDRDDDTAERTGALAAARQYTVDLTTYDFASIDADFGRFARHGTPAFRTSFAATEAATKPTIVKAQSRALGTVVGAGLESFSGDRATVLLAVDQVVRSATRRGSTIERSRIRMTLTRSGGGWLVAAVKVL
jgi:Mce-associated membrane protein